jgi:hypothetical protein
MFMILLMLYRYQATDYFAAGTDIFLPYLPTHLLFQTYPIAPIRVEANSSISGSTSAL